MTVTCICVSFCRPELGYGVIGCVASAIAGVSQPGFAFVITSMVRGAMLMPRVMHAAVGW